MGAENNNTIQFSQISDGNEEMLLKWRNSEDVAPYMYSDHVIESGEHQSWFKSITQNEERSIYRLICVNNDPVGLVSITSINHELRSCSWAFYLASPNTRGTGVGQVTEWWAIEYVFNVLNLNRMECEVLVANDSVIRMHESFGFRRESYLRERCWKSGVALDAVGLSLLKRDWDSVRSNFQVKPKIAAFIESNRTN